MRRNQCQTRVSRREPHQAKRQAPIPAHFAPARNSHRKPYARKIGTDRLMLGVASVISLPSNKLGHCIQPWIPATPIPSVSAATIQADAYRRDCTLRGSWARYHQAAPHVTPANTQPFQAPNPEQPRTAHVMPPSATKSIVGRIRSLSQSVGETRVEFAGWLAGGRSWQWSLARGVIGGDSSAGSSGSRRKATSPGPNKPV